MNYFTISEVKKACNKGTTGAWISDRLLWRPVSPYVTWLCVNLRLSSVFVVTASLVSITAAALLLFSNTQTSLIVAAVAIEVYALLDHVDGETARFEMTRLGKQNSRVGHFLDLLAHKISVIAMFAVGWAVAQATGNDLYTAAAFMLCFFMLGPSNEPANQIVIEEAKKTDMSDALTKLRAFNVVKDPKADDVRPNIFLMLMNELFGFPGWLHLVVAACLLDAFVAPVNALGSSYLYREALVLLLSPIYLAKFFYALHWYLKVMRSIPHG